MSESKSNRISRRIMIIYLILLLIAAISVRIPFIDIANQIFIKWAMNGVLTLSLIPMFNAGVGLNFGLPIGISAGLVGMSLALEWKVTGWSGFWLSILIGSLIAVFFGYFYAKILNSMKGHEEIIGNFMGFTFIPLMNFYWALAPYKNRQLLYPVGGKGLRPKINLDPFFGGILNDWCEIRLGKIRFPLGLILFFLLISLLLHLFLKTKQGYIMSTVADNPEFVRLSGINIDKQRQNSIILSNVLAAIGICIYAQSFGILQLYDGATLLDFPAICALLIGGASGHQATVAQALFGTFLYQTTFLLSVPVANALFIPKAAEIIRMILTNGIIVNVLIIRNHTIFSAQEISSTKAKKAGEI